MGTGLLSGWDTPLGRVTLAGSADELTGLWFDGQANYGAGLTGSERVGECPAFGHVREWLSGYFAGKDAALENVALAPVGSAFQRAVWLLLREIPRGEVVTYGELARRYEKRTGRRTCARAIGGAVGRNPISILIPCHRVIGSDGSLTGYAGGEERKRALLTMEGALR